MIQLLPSVLCHLEDYKVHLRKRFASKQYDRVIKDLNINNNLSLLYKGLRVWIVWSGRS